MTPEQRSRYRRLAEVELERGNALAAILLDALDEMDARAAEPLYPPLRFSGPGAANALVDSIVAPLATLPNHAIDVGPLFNDPPPAPAPAPTVIPLHDLDYGPGGEIETDLGPDPTFEGRAPMRDAPPTTQS